MAHLDWAMKVLDSTYFLPPFGYISLKYLNILFYFMLAFARLFDTAQLMGLLRRVRYGH